MKNFIKFLIISSTMFSFNYSIAQTFNGNLGIFTQTAVDNFNYTHIEGTLTVNGSSIFNNGDPITDLTPLADMIVSVSGSFQIGGTDHPGSINFPNLEVVGDDINSVFGNFLSIPSNTAMTEATFPVLHTIGNQVTSSGLSIITNPLLESVRMPLLENFYGSIVVASNPIISNIDITPILPTASEIEAISITNNSLLSECCVFYNILENFSGSSSIANNATGCNSIDEIEACPVEPIPTVSQWGILLLGLLMIIVGKVYLYNGRHTNFT